ncbi:hypothetical protein BJ508DRAFT_331677 [Ascobolus immersus RN42]|uniref:Protein kinase domain-containing protein n=1 Tax=Ascobolus immersus RN42 TaxID=1160509 RepID=A0A3N4HV67_ASCIM|nr:hypothetical protein BJ508DRAFT_331677 [Ascobolus immersus RN42]
MEPANEQLKRALPTILQRSSKTQGISSTRGVYICENYVSEWQGFEQEVGAYISATDLSFEVPAETCEVEKVLVGNESSLVGRFLQNIGVPLGRVMSVLSSQDLLFGDAYSGTLNLSKSIPDIVLLRQSDGVVTLVGEIKPFWLLALETMDPAEPRSLSALFGPLGQLVRYMFDTKLLFGFLSTYNATIFVRRTERFRFEISRPILAAGTSPSVRQCFAYVAHIASTSGFENDPSFYDEEAASKVFRNPIGIVNSSRVSRGRRPATQGGSSVSSSSVFVQTSLGSFSVELFDEIAHRVFKVRFGAEILCMKVFDEDSVDFFDTEIAGYLAIEEMGGSTVFPKLVGFGEIILANTIGGHAMIISLRAGLPLSELDPAVLSSEQKVMLHSRFTEGIDVLRHLGFFLHDLNPSNVLFDMKSMEVTIVDLESLLENKMGWPIEDGPEALGISEYLP